MPTRDIGDVLLQFATTNQYPESQDITEVQLQHDQLARAVKRLQSERDVVKEEIRTLSKSTGPNVEEWISQAKQLQQDIQRSKQIAQEIVAEHETVQKLRIERGDVAGKIVLLEKEVIFEETLQHTLQSIRGLSSLLSDAKEAIVQGDLGLALSKTQTAKSTVTGLSHIKDTKPLTLLREKGKQVQDSLEFAIEQQWHKHLVVENKACAVVHNDGPHALNKLFSVAEAAGILERLAHKTSRELERTVFMPLLKHSANQYHQAVVNNHQLQLQLQNGLLASSTFFHNLTVTIDFLTTELPETVSPVVIDKLLPKLVNRIETDWLEPSIPVSVSQIPDFERSLDDAEAFADKLDALELTGSEQLRQWFANVPKSWLTKRREALLGDIRQSVFERLRDTRVVERVETEVVKQDDAIANQVNTDGDEDWDVAWDENEDTDHAVSSSTKEQAETTADDEDDGSAWDMGDTEKPDDSPSNAEEAWGWGDEGQGNHATTPIQSIESSKTETKPDKSKEREVTLRESYTVTAIPDSIFEQLQTVIADARTLGGDEYSSAKLAPAAAGLYSLPTLALAIYRATAPTAYTKLASGNMMIYNDAARLSENLRHWQSAETSSSRLRLENDAKALEQFARRAYSAEMLSQRTIIQDLLDGAQGFSSCTVEPFKSACESAVDQVVDRLKHVHASWNGILPNSALLQSLGQLLSTVLTKVISDVEDMEDISEADSKQLKILCERVTSVKELFSQQTPNAEITDMTFIYCPNWLKFQYLAEILESSLADIKYLWHDGELSLEFEPEEVVDLIKALFADSDLRRKAVADIRRQSRR